MDNNQKPNFEKQIEIIAQTVVRIEARVETMGQEIKDDIARLEDKIELGLGKRQQELDDLRDRERLLETRVDKLEVVHG